MDLTSLKAVTLGLLRERRRADYSFACLNLADAYEDAGLVDQAARRRVKAETVRAGKVLWPRPGLVEGPSPHQRERLRRALSRPVGILTGSPGTGKTFVTACLVKYLLDMPGVTHLDLALCAPTGKAAVRLGEHLQAHGVGMRPTTIHQRLEIGRNGHDGGGWAFRRNESNPLDERFVIVDEVSMLSTDLFADLLRACRKGTHLLLVGDPGQLPPVGHGAPLRDMLAAGLPHGRLTEIRRNAGMIVEACAAIRDGLPFEADGPKNPNPDRNLICLEGATPSAQLELLDRFVSTFKQACDTERLDPRAELQVVCALNDASPISREPLNKRLQEAFNPDGKPLLKGYRSGDKVICLKNGLYRAESLSGQAWLANGEIGHVVTGNPQELYAEFTATDRLVVLNAVALDNFALGYAITGHKSQGSEWPTVVVMVDASRAADRVCGREWIYTAISRARDCCYLIGRPEVAQQMARRPMLDQRRTRLKELLGRT